MVCRQFHKVMDLKVVVVVVALMAQVQLSVQLRFNHPLHGVVDRINQKAKGSYIGLVMAYSTEEAALQATGHFVPSLDIPWVDLAGRRFNIGKIKGVDVIYVKSGEEMLNAGITVQILVDAFDIKGIVHYGIAGSANASLSIGDVGVLNDVAFTGSWNWKEFKAEEGTLPELKFGAFNVPENCQNLLANIEFTSQQLFSVGKPVEDVFWQPIEPKWLSIASQLQNLTLQQCLKTYCLPKAPQIVYGLRGSTDNIFLDNEAYRDFLFNQFNISIVDEESVAIVATSRTNGVPSIVFRGVSDSASGENKLSEPSLSSLAAANAVTAALEFIGLLGQKSMVDDH